MNLEDFPMDIQKCPLKFGSCKFIIVNKEFHYLNINLKSHFNIPLKFEIYFLSFILMAINVSNFYIQFASIFRNI